MPRRALILPGAVTAALLLAGCSGGTDGGDDSSGDGEAVTLKHPTIDGLEISFDEQPETLVMDCYAYSSLHEYGIEPDALFGFDCDNPWVMGETDISGIERIGQDGEIDMEKLAELDPDAVIGQGDENGWSWFDEDVNGQLTEVSEFIPLPSAETVQEDIDTTRELADFLGADVEAESIVQADQDLEDAEQRFSDAVEGKDLSFMLASPTEEMLYTGVGFPQADMLEELGVEIVGAEPPAEGNPWGQVAWEEASTYPADVILAEGYDAENPFSTEMWDSLPAVEDDQVSGWGSKGAMTSRAYADWLDELAEKAEGYEKVSES